MRRRAHTQTRFSEWVREVSVAGVVDALNAYTPITSDAVYSWLSGDREPRLSTAAFIVRISDGKVTFADIVQHRLTVKRDHAAVVPLKTFMRAGRFQVRPLATFHRPEQLADPRPRPTPGARPAGGSRGARGA